MKSVHSRFQELFDLVLDDSLSDDERREFAQLIENDHGHAAEIVEQMRAHSLLQWQAEQLTSFTPLADALPAALKSKELSWARRLLSGHPRLMLAAAILLVSCVCWSWIYFRGSSLQVAKSMAVAEIAREDFVDWDEESTALRNHQEVIPGVLKINSGTLTLRFRSGVTLTMFGPVTLQVESDMLVKLAKGQATAHVPHWARGFTVETPDAKVVDLGTRFGVDARNAGLTEVVVFEGEVDVTPATGNATSPTRLTQGEAARVDNFGSLSRILEVHRDHWGESWSTSQRKSSKSVFKAIRDNIKPMESAKYYEIIPRGLVDDAPAYVDRRHQWNGLTPEGLPEFLKGADYVRTFNDYKYRGELEVVIELSQPSMVYIFSDDRVATPEWLSAQFENTGVKIGLDEGPWPEVNPNDPTLSTAIGAGNSIDNVFTVWRRRCDGSQPLILGATGEQIGACAIYGIAAKPLNER